MTVVCIFHRVSPVIHTYILYHMQPPFLLLLFVTLTIVTGISATSSTTDVGTPEIVSGQFAWVTKVTISQLTDTVVLVFLVDANHRGFEPCSEFGNLCCMGLQLQKNVWGGDLKILDTIKNHCELGVKDSWLSVFKPISTRTMVDLEFSLDDIRDPLRVGYATDGFRDVRVLSLVVKKWNGCDDGINDQCVVRLQSIEQILRVDTSNTQQISTVSLPTHCTTDKPVNSFWMPYSDSDLCEWFCDKGFNRCPGYGGVDPACRKLPSTGASMKISAALTRVSNEPVEQMLDQLSVNVARRFREAGVSGVEECAVIVRDINDDVSLAGRVDLPAVKGRIRVNSETFYDGTVLRDATSADPANEPIAIELDNIDDRLLPGFTEITILVYSNNTQFSLATQAVLLRHVLYDTLRLVEGSDTVLYVGDVHGIMHGAEFPGSSLTAERILLLCVWASAVVFLSILSIFCQWKQQSKQDDPENTELHGTVPPAATSLCGDHSPRERVFLVVISVFVLSTIPATVILYIFVVIPRMNSSEDPFVLLGMVWCMFGVCLLTMVTCCCVAKYMRRFQLFLGY